jgi:hypothetical protein
MIEKVASLIDLDAICDVSVGTFRINGTYLRSMQERNPASKLLSHPYTVENGSASYSAEESEELTAFVIEQLHRFVPQEKICPVPWR